jgi:hypothetical protein
MRFTMGLDLGQRQDHSALAVLERLEDGEYRRYECRHLHRFPLGMPYPRIVDAVETILLRPPLVRQCRLAIDATGVGVAVCDMFREAGMPYIGITITGGVDWRRDGRHWYVAKHLLVSVVQKYLSSEALGISKRLADAPLLREELRNFRVKISKAAHEIYEAREHQSDDIVLAVAIALFASEHPAHRFAPVGE